MSWRGWRGRGETGREGPGDVPRQRGIARFRFLPLQCRTHILRSAERLRQGPIILGAGSVDFCGVKHLIDDEIQQIGDIIFDQESFCLPVLNEPLPKFGNPPLVETALSLQFDPPAGMTNGHLGGFWKQLGPDWPTVEDAPPIGDAFERFGDEQRWTAPLTKLRLESQPKLRLLIRDRTKSRLLQVQSTRVIHNWIGQPGVPYPHHEETSKEFANTLKQFRTFLADEKIGELVFNQWEVTYVNHIKRETVWHSAPDWPRAFTCVRENNGIKGLTATEAFQSGWVYEIVPQKGRLHVSIESGHRDAPNGTDLIVMRLTARGPVSNNDSVMNDLALGREAVVRTFADLTTDFSHQFWKRSR